MPKAKPIEKKRMPFELSHPEEAKHLVFEQKRSIMFHECIKAVKGQIIVAPDPSGGAIMTCKAWPVWSNVAKVLVVHCAGQDDFESAFAMASAKTLAKMEEIYDKNGGKA